jgi:hypothetical protein
MIDRVVAAVAVSARDVRVVKYKPKRKPGLAAPVLQLLGPVPKTWITSSLNAY